jgi:hypothetical protein
MAITQNALRTVTPDPSNPGLLLWIGKRPSIVLDFWLDASLEVDATTNVEQFSYEIDYGDGALQVIKQINNGNVCGLLLKGGTSNVIYSIRISALLEDERLLNWDVSFPVLFEQLLPEVYGDTVTVKNAALLFAGRSLPTSIFSTVFNTVLVGNNILLYAGRSLPVFVNGAS